MSSFLAQIGSVSKPASGGGGGGGSIDPETVFDDFYWEADFAALADDDPFTALTDQISATNATQGDGARRALNKTGIVNGLPVARFDGSNDRYVRAFGTDATFTIAFITKGTGVLLGGTDYLWIKNATDVEVALDDNYPLFSGFTALSSAFSLVMFIADGVNLKAYQNGTLVGTDTDYGSWSTDVIGDLNSALPFNGDVAVLGYAAFAFDGTQRAGVAEWLMDKYGL